VWKSEVFEINMHMCCDLMACEVVMELESSARQQTSGVLDTRPAGSESCRESSAQWKSC
jgi:hypothetical protein